MKNLKSLKTVIGKTVNLVGRFLLEAATAIGLFACATCARMGLSAIIHAESGFHWFPETYWSGREEWYCGMTALVVSIAAAIVIAYWRYIVTSTDSDDDQGVENNSAMTIINNVAASDDSPQETAKTPTDECKETQDAISFMYFLGFAVVSVVWTIVTASADTHWTDFAMGKVARNSAITAVLCVALMGVGDIVSSFYSEEETK